MCGVAVEVFLLVEPEYVVGDGAALDVYSTSQVARPQAQVDLGVHAFVVGIHRRADAVLAQPHAIHEKHSDVSMLSVCRR